MKKYLLVVLVAALSFYVVVTKREVQTPMYGHIDPSILTVKSGDKTAETNSPPSSAPEVSAMKVVYTVTAKKNMSCVMLTKSSPYPLNSKECRVLAKEHIRKMKGDVILVKDDEDLYLVEETTPNNKILYWKIPYGK